METSIFTALFQQVINSPASLLVIVGLSVIAYLLEVWPRFNSKFIPHICVLAGACSYWLFSSRSSVPPGFPHPAAVLVVNGIICGFISFLVHVSLIANLIKRFGTAGPAQPPTNPQNPS